MKIRISFFLLLVSLLYSLNFKQIAYIPKGITWSYGYIQGLDINRDGQNDITFSCTTPIPLSLNRFSKISLLDTALIAYYGYESFNRFIFRDSIFYTNVFWDIGDLDGDSLYDVVIHGIWDTLSIYEQESLNTYPKKRVWKYGFPPQVYNWQPMYIVDLDKDGKKEVLCGDDRFLYVFENVGNNQYQIVYFDSVPRDRGKFSFAVDDFDYDGNIEFIASSDDGFRNVLIYECTGNDQYRFIREETVPWPTNWDAIKLGDLDGDGKKEFLIGGAYGGIRFANLMAIFETVGDNQFEIIFMDSVENRLSPFGFHSDCGDVDSDGKNELIWASISDWMIYTATGNNQFQRIYSQYNGNNGHNCTNIHIYDLNKNGYPEIIESGGNETHIFEIEGVRLLYPNGGEILKPDSQITIRWRKFTPPGADSFMIFFSSDNGRTYNDTIARVPFPDESTFVWRVPNRLSDSCKLMIWAYGPPRPGENKPRGTAWDFSDSTFVIRQTGITEDTRYSILDTGLKILQNPARREIRLQISEDRGQKSDSRSQKIELKIYDVSGKMVKSFNPGSLPPAIPMNPGVYFVRFESKDKIITKKVVVIE